MPSMRSLVFGRIWKRHVRMQIWTVSDGKQNERALSLNGITCCVCARDANQNMYSFTCAPADPRFPGWPWETIRTFVSAYHYIDLYPILSTSGHISFNCSHTSLTKRRRKWCLRANFPIRWAELIHHVSQLFGFAEYENTFWTHFARRNLVEWNSSRFSCQSYHPCSAQFLFRNPYIHFGSIYFAWSWWCTCDIDHGILIGLLKFKVSQSHSIPHKDRHLSDFFSANRIWVLCLNSVLSRTMTHSRIEWTM